MGKKTFTTEQARSIGEAVGVDWRASPFDVEQFRMGLDIELEHGLVNRQTNVTSSDPIITGKIALAHLQEFPDDDTRPRAHGGRGRGEAAEVTTSGDLLTDGVRT